MTDVLGHGVADLPRRTAHALHALLCAADDQHGPPSASEVVIYDEEAPSARSTAAALTSARRRGYCFCTNGFWWPTHHAYDARNDLEERFLADTEREDDE